jgi:hypothetical protein
MAVFPRFLGVSVSLSLALSLTGAIAIPEPSILAATAAIAQDSFFAFEEGYQMGYRLGLEQGRESRQAKADYNPQILGVGNDLEYDYETEDDKRALVGYKAGFLAGFHDGYYPMVDIETVEIERFNNGYTEGFEAGSRDAIACRQTPNCFYEPLPNSGNPKDKQYHSGYQIGYWQAFDREWMNAL